MGCLAKGRNGTVLMLAMSAVLRILEQLFLFGVLKLQFYPDSPSRWLSVCCWWGMEVAVVVWAYRPLRTSASIDSRSLTRDHAREIMSSKHGDHYHGQFVPSMQVLLPHDAALGGATGVAKHEDQAASAVSFPTSERSWKSI